jgi:nucleoside-diphosphate-sugar epimerase
MTQNILITGGRGFIGSYLANHYRDKYTVLAPQRSRLDFTNSASVDSFFNTNKVDVVIHTALAGRNNINGVDHQQAQQNMEMFLNVWRNRHKFKKLINMGTGNEFDTTTDILRATEDTLFDRVPMSSYGYSKNLIARICRETENFTNLRIFGMYHHTEKPERFFQKLHRATSEQPLSIWQDCYFDFFNLDDFPTVIDTVLNEQLPFNDMNVVYPEKYLFSELAEKFLEIHNHNADGVRIEAQGGNSFSGDSSRLDSLNLKFKGLEEGFKLYK